MVASSGKLKKRSWKNSRKSGKSSLKNYNRCFSEKYERYYSIKFENIPCTSLSNFTSISIFKKNIFHNCLWYLIMVDFFLLYN